MQSEFLPALPALATLVEECAHARAHALRDPDDSAWALRVIHAEAAGRELLLAWLRPGAFPQRMSLSLELKRLLGLVQTLILASAPEAQSAPTLTVICRHVEVVDEVALLLRDSAVLTVLAARGDGAMDVVVTLDVEQGAVRLRVESDQPCSDSAPMYPHSAALCRALATLGGTCSMHETPHQSWLVDMHVPARLERTTQ